MATVADSFKSLGKTQLGMLAGVGFLLLGFFAIIAIRVSAPSFTTMYSNLNMEDSGKIVAQLEQQGVPYQIRANGSEIAVPSDKMLRMRMSMAEQGLPSVGNVMGYEIFDKSDNFGTSQFVLNINAARALEGELSRTIGAFQQVESARVHLVMPKRELFSRDKQDPTASVALKLRGNMEMEKGQIAAIVNFVAASVPGLKPSKVTVVDNFGRLLARAEEEGSLGMIANDSAEFRMNYENRLKDKLEEIVEKVVGPGRVNVKVTADINFDREVTNKEVFDPEGQVARSTQSTTETGKSNEKGGQDSVTVANQLPNAQAGAGGAGAGASNETEKTDETTNFEISKTVMNQVKEGGRVTKLSVAVLVDGNYIDVDGKMTYQVRPQEELDRIQTLVRSAMGFDEARGDKVEVVSMRFVKPEEVEIKETFFDKFKDKFEGIIQTLIFAVIAILVILLVIRPAIMHVIRNSAPATERLAEGLASIGDAANNALGRLPAGGGGGTGGGAQAQPEEEEVMINIGNIKGRVRSSMIKQVSEFVDQNPEESLSVIRQWMAKE
jgi:flagellar M-ring protein FliF